MNLQTQPILYFRTKLRSCCLKICSVSLVREKLKRNDANVQAAVHAIGGLSKWYIKKKIKVLPSSVLLLSFDCVCVVGVE